MPKGFDVPAGVTITKGGSTLELGKSASVVYQVEEGAASAVTVTVNEVKKGDIKKDFTFFSLDEKRSPRRRTTCGSAVVNNGPSGLGGVAIPVLAHTRSNTVFPPNELVGTFKPCPNPALPESFLEGVEGRPLPRLPAAEGREAADASTCRPARKPTPSTGSPDSSDRRVPGGCILGRQVHDRGRPTER